MKINVTRQPAASVRAFEVPIGQCYTWGTGVHHYLRVNTGGVCLTDGAYIPFDPANRAHFESVVRVGVGIINLEYPE